MLAGLSSLLTAGGLLYAAQRGLSSDYSLEQDRVVVSQTSSTASDYEMSDIVRTHGVEGGVAESTDYSISDTAPEDGLNESAAVSDWWIVR